MFSGLLLQIQPNLDLGKLQFRSDEVSSLSLVIPFAALAVVMIAAGVGMFFYFRGSGQREELSRQRGENRIKLLISEFNLSEDDQEFFRTVTGSNSPGRYIPLLEFRTEFEQAVDEFRGENPNHPALAQVANLRQKLGYGFGNMRNAFADTRMLPVGSRLQCQIPQKDKDIVFLTNIVGTNERHFFIRPPLAKGQPVSLAKFPQLCLKISREGDAEYEINVNVVGETANAMKAVVLAHTKEIQKLAFRNAPRMNVSMETKFFVVRQEVASESSHNKFKAKDSQYSFVGNIKDLSIGGALVVMRVTANSPAVGDWVVFRLADAQISDDLVGEVVRLTSISETVLQVHLRFSGIKEINRLKMNKYLENLLSPEAQSAAGA